MDSEFKIQKPLLSRYMQLDYRCIVHIRPHHLPYIVDCCLRKLLSKDNYNSEELYDVKGGDVHDLKGEKTGEEVYFLEGTIAPDDSHSVPFTASMHSHFKAFEGQRHILHTLSSTRSLSLPDYIPDYLLGFSPGIKTSTFRFSLEFFTSRFTTSAFGYSPMVTESLTLSAGQQELSIEISSEVKKGSKPLPLTRNNTLKHLADALELASGESLMNDLTKQYKLP